MVKTLYTFWHSGYDTYAEFESIEDALKHAPKIGAMIVSASTDEEKKKYYGDEHDEKNV